MYNGTKEQERVYVNEASLGEPTCLPMSDFQRLYESLQSAIQHSDDLSYELLKYGNNIKPIQEVEELNKLTEKVPQGVVEMLFDQVWKLQRTNDSLVMLANHLRETVGF